MESSLALRCRDYAFMKGTIITIKHARYWIDATTKCIYNIFPTKIKAKLQQTVVHRANGWRCLRLVGSRDSHTIAMGCVTVCIVLYRCLCVEVYSCMHLLATQPDSARNGGYTGYQCLSRTCSRGPIPWPNPFTYWGFNVELHNIVLIEWRRKFCCETYL